MGKTLKGMEDLPIDAMKFSVIGGIIVGKDKNIADRISK